MQREEILKLNTDLRQSNEELERFAYICSHDMQEPVRMMNTLRGAAGGELRGIAGREGQ